MSYIKMRVWFLTSNMNKIIDGVLLVEGKSDIAFLSSFIDTYFFDTNGYDLSKEKIDFLKRVSKVNKIIVFTDPDDAGENIRKKIINQINGVFEAKIKKNSRKNYIKSGVAESYKEDILLALKDYISDGELPRVNYDLNTLISLDANPQEKREEIINRFGLLKGNNRYLEKQLNMLKITKEELWK